MIRNDRLFHGISTQISGTQAESIGQIHKHAALSNDDTSPTIMTDPELRPVDHSLFADKIEWQQKNKVPTTKFYLHRDDERGISLGYYPNGQAPHVTVTGQWPADPRAELQALIADQKLAHLMAELTVHGETRRLPS